MSTHLSPDSCTFVFTLHRMLYRGVDRARKRVSCSATKWVADWNLVIVTFLAQIAVTLR